MTDKLCCRCGLLPRMLNRAGQPLTMCQICQRGAWRGYKPAPKRQPKPPKNKPTPTPIPAPPPPAPPPKAAQQQQAQRIENDLKRELIATRFELARLRRMIQTASSIDEIRGQL